MHGTVSQAVQYVGDSASLRVEQREAVSRHLTALMHELRSMSLQNSKQKSILDYFGA